MVKPILAMPGFWNHMDNPILAMLAFWVHMVPQTFPYLEDITMLVHENFHQISQCSSTTASSYVCITSLFEVDPRHCCQCVELSFSTFETDLKPFCFISNIKGRLAGHGAIAPVLLQVFIIITISQSMISLLALISPFSLANYSAAILPS